MPEYHSSRGKIDENIAYTGDVNKILLIAQKGYVFILDTHSWPLSIGFSKSQESLGSPNPQPDTSPPLIFIGQKKWLGGMSEKGLTLRLN